MCFEKCCCWMEALASLFRQGRAAPFGVCAQFRGTVEAAELSPSGSVLLLQAVVSRSTCPCAKAGLRGVLATKSPEQVRGALPGGQGCSSA